MAHIYVKQYSNDGFTWDNSWEIPFTEYSIDESDYRNRTAKFKSSMMLDTSQASWAVKITNPHHETFTGIILKRDMKPLDVMEYSCQDWNRIYMTKPRMNEKKQVYYLIKQALRYGDNWKYSWKGLLAKNKYEQRKYGSTISFNPMKTVKNISAKDKTVKEIIENLVYSQKPFIDIHYNNLGVMKFTPYHIDTWLKGVASFHYTECTDFTYTFDTTNIITRAQANGKFYTFEQLFNSKTNPLLGFVDTWTDITEENTNNKTTDKTVNKKGNKDKTNNPYNTKKKEVWVSMDRAWGDAANHKYLNTFCKECKKLGWKVHNLGVSPGTQVNANKASKAKNGIWLTLNNGVDCEIFRHMGHDKWFKKVLLKNHNRAVLGFIGNSAGDIRRGGKYYKYLGMAHDGTGKGNPGLKYPAGYLADCAVPFFYSKGNNPKDAARLFNSGGESKVALENDYSKRVKGYYKNWNWGNKY